MWPLEDKRLLVLKDSVAVVVGYEHPPGCYVAYVKYVYGEGPWKLYERKVKEYSPESVSWTRGTYDPNFGSVVPLVCENEVLASPDPLERAEELAFRVRDEVEETALKLIELIPYKVGIGGSLLLGIHHADSDVDLLIYDEKDPLGTWYWLEELPLDAEVEWVINVSRRTKLPVETVKKLYTKAVRAVFNGRPVSFSFVRRRFERYGSSAARPVGLFVGVLHFSEGPEDAFYYPHRRVAGDVILESYESAFLKAIVECDSVKVKGLMYVKPDGTKVIRVGTKELMGYVLPARSCRL